MHTRRFNVRGRVVAPRAEPDNGIEFTAASNRGCVSIRELVSYVVQKVADLYYCLQSPFPIVFVQVPKLRPVVSAADLFSIT